MAKVQVAPTSPTPASPVPRANRGASRPPAMRGAPVPGSRAVPARGGAGPPVRQLRARRRRPHQHVALLHACSSSASTSCSACRGSSRSRRRRSPRSADTRPRGRRARRSFGTDTFWVGLVVGVVVACVHRGRPSRASCAGRRSSISRSRRSGSRRSSSRSSGAGPDFSGRSAGDTTAGIRPITFFGYEITRRERVPHLLGVAGGAGAS